MTGCGCHDVTTFGHGWACDDELGPQSTGGTRATESLSGGEHRQEYPREIPEPKRASPGPLAMAAMGEWLSRIRVPNPWSNPPVS